MTENIEYQQLCRRYLLGTLADEGKGLEERLMLDDELFEELLIAEDELIDDYLRGKLTSAEARQFREHFLASPQHRRALEFAETLLSSLAAEPEADAAPKEKGGRTTPPWFYSLTAVFRSPKVGFALAASLLLLLLSGVWLATRAPRSPEMARAPDNQPTPGLPARTPPDTLEGNRRPEETPTPADQSRPGPTEEPRNQNSALPANTRTSPQVFTVALALGALRDAGGLKKVSIPPQAATVRLRLALAPEADEFGSLRAELKNDAGATLLSTEALRAGGAKGARTASWMVPAHLLKRADYEVVLSGRTPEGDWETLGRYNFRVLGQ